MVVIDSSTVVAALISGSPAGRWAESLIAEHALCSPALVLVETTSVLRRMELGKALATAEANAAHADLMELEIELFPFDPFAERVWELRRTVTSYDAWYVAVAETLGLPLATLDERLVNSHGPRCQFLLPEPE